MNQEDIRILGLGALKAKILDLGLLKISLMDVFVLFLATAVSYTNPFSNLAVGQS